MVHLGQQLDSGRKVDPGCQGANSIRGADLAILFNWALGMETQNLARNSCLDFPQQPIDFLH